MRVFDDCGIIDSTQQLVVVSHLDSIGLLQVSYVDLSAARAAYSQNCRAEHQSPTHRASRSPRSLFGRSAQHWN